MKILDLEQRTPEWLEARAGIPTASELDNLISPTGKIRTGDTPETYLCRKLAERWMGCPIQSASTWAMEQGSILEDEALPWYELTYGVDAERVGFATTDDGTFGCSPDALVRDGEKVVRGIEIKCPQPTNHVRNLLAGEVPKEYLFQLHGGMYVTGAPEWVFLSYCPKFPALVLTVKRDEALIASIDAAVREFTQRLRDGWDRLMAKEDGL